MSELRVIWAIFKRNYLSFFSSVLGYLFIVVFVGVGALLAFQPQFFTDNLATLDHLSKWFHFLLLFLVPAITMSAWADERKLGTDELLFTLPASDCSILVGKYLALLAVYTTALLFTAPFLIWLNWLGDPDMGVIFTTYLGYWFAGASVLAIGLFASSLTDSATVAFTLGSTLGAIPVFIGELPFWREIFTSLSLTEHLKDFTLGIIPGTGVLYFVSLTIFMLYLNYVVITKRHWSAEQGINMGAQYLVRVLSLAAFLVCVNMLSIFANFRIDMTAENIYTLSKITKEAIDNIDDEHPVTIQAYVSPRVPEDYVPVRKRLLGLLRQYDNLGGQNLKVRVVDVEPFSEEAEEARLQEVTPWQVDVEEDGRTISEQIYLGVVVSSNYDAVVIPFLGPGSYTEYELTAALNTVTNEKRYTVGILKTPAEVVGESADWEIVKKLRQVYEVVEVTPESLVDDPENGEDQKEYDVLVAPMPSLLTQAQMVALVDYIREGHPTLIFDDPFPFVHYSNSRGIQVAPRLPPGQQAPPKADGGRATMLLDTLKIGWKYDQVVADLFNPHPEYEDVLFPEFTFIAPGNGLKDALNPKSKITRGLQEVMMLFAGTVARQKNSPYDFTPLLKTSVNSGLMDWEDFTENYERFPIQMRQIMMSRGIPLKQERSPKVDKFYYITAAHIQNDRSPRLNVVYVADLDIIADWIVREREEDRFNLDLDNVTFVLNAIDLLADNEDHLELRSRRPQNRTLTRFEGIVSDIEANRLKEQTEADKEADQVVEDLEKNYAKQTKAIQDDPNLDSKSRDLKLTRLNATRDRVLQVKRQNVAREKRERRERTKAQTEREKRRWERGLQYRAVFISPIPAVVLGLLVLIMKMYQEQTSIAHDRRSR